MNIEYSDITAFKRYNLPELVQSYGIEVKQHGGGWTARCPFHDDNNPSLSINQKGDIWLWHCFGCGLGGTVIDFVRRKENLTLAETYARLKELTGCKGQKSENPSNRLELLKNVMDFYEKTFYGDARAAEYLKGRGIEGEEIYKTFRLGYANGTLMGALPVEGGLRRNLCETGVLNDKDTEFFYNCVVIPLFDEDGNVVSLYGRNIARKSHLYLKGDHEGLVNRQGAYGAKKVILTESILDGISLYKMGVRNVVPCYGTGGFTEDHRELLKKERVKEVEFAFDNDDVGIKSSERLSKVLADMNISSMRVKLPDGVKDMNDLLVRGDTAEDYKSLKRDCSPRFAGEAAGSPRGPQLRREASEAAGLPRGEAAGVAPASSGLATAVEENGLLTIMRDGRVYRVRAASYETIHQMKVNIKLTAGEDYTIDVVDLYSERSRDGYAKRVSKRFNISLEDIERDVYMILEEVEKRQKKDDGAESAGDPPMSEKEKEEALEALRSPDLVRMIIDDLESIGCVGEDMNKVLGYMVTVSRRLDMPLSMIIVSQSGAGKSSLADTLESVIPPEECVHLSRITPQALYYMDRQALKRRVLIIEEKEGSDSADYSIRVLQSKSVLRLAVPIKDMATSRVKTKIFEVEGPVAVIETTTKTDLNPENTSRCFIVYLDESEAQTKRIHGYQKRKKTIEGARERSGVERIIRKHRNMQRLLEGVVVHNPYVDHIEFPAKWIRGRRDHMRYLNLVEAVTFLRQKQRETKRTDEGIEYIESTVDDYRVAYRIAMDVIGDCTAELMKPVREFFENLRDITRRHGQKLSRRHIRTYTGLPDHVVRKYLTALVELEYLAVVEGKKGQRYQYMINPEFTRKEEIIAGLTTPEEIEKRIDAEKLIASVKP